MVFSAPVSPGAGRNFPASLQKGKIGTDVVAIPLREAWLGQKSPHVHVDVRICVTGVLGTCEYDNCHILAAIFGAVFFQSLSVLAFLHVAVFYIKNGSRETPHPRLSKQAVAPKAQQANLSAAAQGHPNHITSLASARPLWTPKTSDRQPFVVVCVVLFAYVL